MMNEMKMVHAVIKRLIIYMIIYIYLYKKPKMALVVGMQRLGRVTPVCYG